MISKHVEDVSQEFISMLRAKGLAVDCSTGQIAAKSIESVEKYSVLS